MAKNYVAIDMGATSGRVILATLDNCKIEMETIHRFPTPLIHIGGHYYWNIYSIYSDIIHGLSILGSRGIKIESIGVDTWGVDVAPIAPDGSVGLPHAYRDPYTEGAPEKFFSEFSREKLYDRTGIQIMNFNTVFQLYAQDRGVCSSFMDAECFLFMPDALSYLLTGNKVCEYTILSTSALMDPRVKEIDEEILAVCHLDRSKFGKIVMPGTKVGDLTDELVKQTGLGKVPVIAVAGHDTASAVAAVPAQDEHFAYLSSGTWSLMGIETREPVINEEMFAKNYTNEGGVGGTTRLLRNITGMWLLEQCLAKWRTEGREYKYDQIHSMAAACPQCKEVLDPDDPSFATPQDMPAAIRKYCEAKSMAVPEDDAHIVRLIYDSLASKYAATLEFLRKVSPVEIDTLHIIGGGSQNQLLNQLTADACGIKVVAGPAEGTALGNVMIQAGLSRKDIAQSIDTKTYYPTTL